MKLMVLVTIIVICIAALNRSERINQVFEKIGLVIVSLAIIAIITFLTGSAILLVEIYEADERMEKRLEECQIIIDEVNSKEQYLQVNNGK